MDIYESFYSSFNSHPDIKALAEKLTAKTATHDDAYRFSEVVSKILGDNFEISGDVSGELSKAFGIQFEEVDGYARNVQQIVNEKSGVKLNAIAQEARNNKKVLTYLTGLDDNELTTKLEEQLTQLGYKVVDGSIRANASYQDKLGFKSYVTRHYEGMHKEHTNHKDGGKLVDCKWCKNLARGSPYLYVDVKNAGNDVWKRHEGCRCRMSFIPNPGDTRTLTAKGHGFKE